MRQVGTTKKSGGGGKGILAFEHFNARFSKISPDQRVWVLLDLMGRTARVAVRPEALQAVGH